MKEEITRKIENILNGMIIKNTTYQNLWDTAKVLLEEKFVALNAYFSKEKKCKINYVIFHFKNLGKEEQTIFVNLHKVSYSK